MKQLARKILIPFLIVLAACSGQTEAAPPHI